MNVSGSLRCDWVAGWESGNREVTKNWAGLHELRRVSEKTMILVLICMRLRSHQAWQASIVSCSSWALVAMRTRRST